jgi:hypothetical protein
MVGMCQIARRRIAESGTWYWGLRTVPITHSMLIIQVDTIHLKVRQRLFAALAHKFGFTRNTGSIFGVIDSKFGADKDFGAEFEVFEQRSDELFVLSLWR